jgi:DNA-binding NarL/FixJ family response regulator
LNEKARPIVRNAEVKAALRKLPTLVAVLVGPSPFHNELLAGMLREQLGAVCEVLRHDCRRLASVLRACTESGIQPNLILIDAGSAGYPLDSRGVFAGPERPRSPVALMNLEPDTDIERHALAAGYRGFFYRTDSVDLFVRGVRSIHTGEVWVSRAVLAQCLTGKVASDGADATSKATLLSPREIEVLALVAMGSTNEDVAEMLSVSSNTVKTHLYSIFKKIGVPSRLQAALWAAKNL